MGLRGWEDGIVLSGVYLSIYFSFLFFLCSEAESPTFFLFFFLFLHSRWAGYETLDRLHGFGTLGNWKIDGTV